MVIDRCCGIVHESDIVDGGFEGAISGDIVGSMGYISMNVKEIREYDTTYSGRDSAALAGTVDGSCRSIAPEIRGF